VSHNQIFFSVYLQVVQPENTEWCSAVGMLQDKSLQIKKGHRFLIL